MKNILFIVFLLAVTSIFGTSSCSNAQDESESNNSSDTLSIENTTTVDSVDSIAINNDTISVNDSIFSTNEDVLPEMPNDQIEDESKQPEVEPSLENNNQNLETENIQNAEQARIDALRTEMIQIEGKLLREREQFNRLYQQYRSLMSQYGTTRTNPYFFDDMMGVINRVINLSERGKKIATELGNYEMVENYEKDLQMARNAKNYLIINH